MLNYWRCVFGPALYRVHSSATVKGAQYEPNALEHYSDLIISLGGAIWYVTRWASPLLVWQAWSGSSPGWLGRAALLAVLVYWAAVLARGAGRLRQPLYQQLMATLQQVTAATAAPATAGGGGAAAVSTEQTRALITKYDFDTIAWPIDYTAEPTRGPGVVPPSVNGGWLLNAASYVLAKSVGLSLMYPGSLSLMQNILKPHLIEGRAKLVEKFGGQRYMLRAADGSLIDTMFVDRRNRSAVSGAAAIGNRLMITCEGNAGFYEIGAMYSPLEEGYSVLGWNHPGFAGSQGEPTPYAERCAIDAVLQFAERRLAFSLQHVTVYGWSIGGYTASWAVANHPAIAAVVLDATFDDVAPLAVAQMPAIAAPLVRVACRRHLNLHVAALLTQYAGAVRLIRRSGDEVVATERGDCGSNRGNQLLLQLLRHRYPCVAGEQSPQQLQQQLHSWLNRDTSDRTEALREFEVDQQMCASLVAKHEGDLSLLGQNESDNVRSQLLIYLANRHMIDYKSTHTEPLPSEFLGQDFKV